MGGIPLKSAFQIKLQKTNKNCCNISNRFTLHKAYKPMEEWILLQTVNIHNVPLQSFNQVYGLVAPTIHVVCVTLIRECWNLQFSIDYERKIFEQLFHGRLIYSYGVFFSTKKCALYLKKCNFVFISSKSFAL